MRDAGLPSRRENARVANALSKTMQERMVYWTEDNFGLFEETMDLVRQGAPVQWLKLYMEAIKLGLDKSTNINININRQQDRENLQALVRSRIPTALPQNIGSHAALPSNEQAVYTPYIEVATQPDPSEKR